MTEQGSDRSTKLEPLDALVGEWALGDPAAPLGRATFSWLEGGRFLIQRWTVAIPEAPDGIAILGEDEASGELVQHYFDSRGVARRYGMTMEDGVWKLWRHDPDFWQRFSGKLSDDASTITGAWETSFDKGALWEHDFDLVYTRVR